jgi:aryl-alcohol dehydrogenase-like predicted oxidoreductase
MPSGALPHRRLGRTGLEVSYPALGCGALDRAGSDAAAVEIVHRAIEHGVNYLDVAPL